MNINHKNKFQVFKFSKEKTVEEYNVKEETTILTFSKPLFI